MKIGYGTTAGSSFARSSSDVTVTNAGVADPKRTSKFITVSITHALMDDGLLPGSTPHAC